MPDNPSLGVIEDVLTGARVLRRAFLQLPLVSAGSGASLLRVGEHGRRLFLIRSGFAFRSCVLADGRRAIVDVLVPGDIAGLDHGVVSRPMGEVAALSRLSYHLLDRAAVDALLAERSVVLYLFSVLAEARWRSDRLSVMLGRLDALSRIAALLLDIYDRLHRRGLTSDMSFNLPLTQDQMADFLGLTLVHVNRTLRRMREERLATMRRQTVVIYDLGAMRALVNGLPEPEHPPDLPLPAL